MKKLVMVIVFVVLLSFVHAELTVELDVKDSFSKGEEILFDYSITGGEDVNISFYPYMDCPDAPMPLISEREVELKSGVPYTDTYTDFIVTDFLEPQTCTAYVQILSPVEQRKEKTFEIITDPSFSFKIELDKKVFVKGKEIEIDYDCAVSGVDIEAVLIYPSGASEDINLPKTITAEQIGTYEIEATATKEGYKTVAVKEQFGVIEKRAEIGPVGADIDKEDAKTSWIPKDKLFTVFLLILLGLIIAIVVILVRFRRWKVGKKKKKK